MTKVSSHRVLDMFPSSTQVGETYYIKKDGYVTEWLIQNDGTPIQVTPRRYFETIIWAEENGAVANGTDEWSYGNGSVGANIGIPSFWDCQAVGMVLNAETVGTSLSVNLRINTADAGIINATQRDNFVDFATPVDIARGDRINFKTNTEVGVWSDVRVAVVLRIYTN